MLGLTMTESIPRQVDRKPGIPEEERRVWGSGILKEEERTNTFYSLHSLVLGI